MRGEGSSRAAELATFRTTSSKTAAAGGRDLAAGAKVVAVSSQFGGGFRAANAVDGNLATEWSSAGDGNRASITIDLGGERKVGGVAFLTREMSDGSAITRTFAVVVDGGKRYGPFPAGTRVDPRVATVSFTGRRLRFEVVTSSGGNTGAAEIEVFPGSTSPTSLAGACNFRKERRFWAARRSAARRARRRAEVRPGCDLAGDRRFATAASGRNDTPWSPVWT